jgi:hypothetical protein
MVENHFMKKSIFKRVVSLLNIAAMFMTSQGVMAQVVIDDIIINRERRSSPSLDFDWKTLGTSSSIPQVNTWRGAGSLDFNISPTVCYGGYGGLNRVEIKSLSSLYQFMDFYAPGHKDECFISADQEGIDLTSIEGATNYCSCIKSKELTPSEVLAVEGSLEQSLWDDYQQFSREDLQQNEVSNLNAAVKLFEVASLPVRLYNTGPYRDMFPGYNDELKGACQEGDISAMLETLDDDAKLGCSSEGLEKLKQQVALSAKKVPGQENVSSLEDVAANVNHRVAEYMLKDHPKLLSEYERFIQLPKNGANKVARGNEFFKLLDEVRLLKDQDSDAINDGKYKDFLAYDGVAAYIDGVREFYNPDNKSGFDERLNKIFSDWDGGNGRTTFLPEEKELLAFLAGEPLLSFSIDNSSRREKNRSIHRGEHENARSAEAAAIHAGVGLAGALAGFFNNSSGGGQFGTQTEIIPVAIAIEENDRELIVLERIKEQMREIERQANKVARNAKAGKTSVSISASEIFFQEIKGQVAKAAMTCQNSKLMMARYCRHHSNEPAGSWSGLDFLGKNLPKDSSGEIDGRDSLKRRLACAVMSDGSEIAKPQKQELGPDGKIIVADHCRAIREAYLGSLMPGSAASQFDNSCSNRFNLEIANLEAMKKAAGFVNKGGETTESGGSGDNRFASSRDQGSERLARDGINIKSSRDLRNEDAARLASTADAIYGGGNREGVFGTPVEAPTSLTGDIRDAVSAAMGGDNATVTSSANYADYGDRLIRDDLDKGEKSEKSDKSETSDAVANRLKSLEDTMRKMETKGTEIAPETGEAVAESPAYQAQMQALQAEIASLKQELAENKRKKESDTRTAAAGSDFGPVSSARNSNGRSPSSFGSSSGVRGAERPAVIPTQGPGSTGSSSSSGSNRSFSNSGSGGSFSGSGGSGAAPVLGWEPFARGSGIVLTASQLRSATVAKSSSEASSLLANSPGQQVYVKLSENVYERYEYVLGDDGKPLLGEDGKPKLKVTKVTADSAIAEKKPAKKEVLPARSPASDAAADARARARLRELEQALDLGVSAGR